MSTCCEMLTMAASWPPPVTRLVRSGEPGKTVATSATRIVAPRRTATGVSAIWAGEEKRPEASTRFCRPADGKRPTGASWLAVRRASETSCTVRPVARSFPGSVTTSNSRLSVAMTSTLPTPGTRDTAGRTTKKA